MAEQKAPFFTKEDFELIARYEKTPYNKESQDSTEVYKALKIVYCKLQELAKGTAGADFKINSNSRPTDGTYVQFSDYMWVKLYPTAYPDTEGKVMFTIRLDKTGLKLAIDRYGDKVNKHIGDEAKAKADDIREKSTVSILTEQVCQLTKDELIAEIKAYYNDATHKIEFFKLGNIFGIESCVKEYDKIQMEEYKKLLLNSKNLILTGAPGTGKTYLAKKIAEAIVGEDKPDHIGFVQFHPSYDYTDFVEGLRPVSKNETIGFERKDGIFMEFCRKALKDPDIDEINRGDMSKILGELFFSIDPGYRGKEGSVSTQYSNLWENHEDETLRKFDDSDKFYIPENVYIIGTMNDIDRSVESMDFAIRRRFTFKEVTPEERMSMISNSDKFTPDIKKEITERMTALNSKIKTEETLGDAYQIGPAYFLKLKNYLDSDSKWDDLWNLHLKGLLFEYLRGEPKDTRDNLLKEFKKAYNPTENKGKNKKGTNNATTLPPEGNTPQKEDEANSNDESDNNPEQ